MEKLKINNLPNYIHLIHSITYIGIGACRYSDWSIHSDQQYPYMIRQAKESHKDIHINLILMDPVFQREKPPTCGQQLDAQPDKYFNNVYHTKDGVHIYVYDESVKYIPQFASFEMTHGTDITPFLTQMNQLCCENDGIMITHDFSGMDIDILAEYFDKSIDHQHILYDMSCRTGISCLIDFNQLYCTLRIGKTMEIFNPFVVDYSKIQEIYRQSDDEQIKRQIILCTQYHKKKFIKLYFHNLRMGKLWQLRCQSGREADVSKRVIRISEIKMLDHLHGTNLEHSLNTDDVNIFVNTMGQLFTYQCYDLGMIFHFDGYEIMKIILSIDEPNLWIDHIVRYMDNIRID